MDTFKPFLIGVICTALACSVAFNCYQQGQLKNCVVAHVEPIDLK